MEDIRSKGYAEFMEKALKGMMEFDVEGICIITKAKGDLMYTCYHNSSVMDKIAYAGLIQQDAMVDMLKANKLIKETSSTSLMFLLWQPCMCTSLCTAII